MAVFILLVKKQCFVVFKGHKISIIPFCQAGDIYYEGLKYPLNGERLVFGQRIGTRNIAIADTVNIRYGSGQLLVYIENQNYIKERFKLMFDSSALNKLKKEIFNKPLIDLFSQDKNRF